MKMTWPEVRTRWAKAIGFTVFVMGTALGGSILLVQYAVESEFPVQRSLVPVYVFLLVMLSPALLLMGWGLFKPERLVAIERRREEDRLLERADQIRARRTRESP